MRWDPWGQYARRCVEYQLAISKAKVKAGWIYTLWRLSSVRDERYSTYQAKPDDLIGMFNSFEAAKEAAEDLVENGKRD